MEKEMGATAQKIEKALAGIGLEVRRVSASYYPGNNFEPTYLIAAGTASASSDCPERQIFDQGDLSNNHPETLKPLCNESST